MTNALVLAPSVAGYGGIQYSARIVVHALRGILGAGAHLSLAARLDSPGELARLRLPCQAWGGGGSLLRTGWKMLRLWRSKPWDLVILCHLNLAPLVLLARRFSAGPVLAIIHGREAWVPLGPLRRQGLLQVDKLLYVSQRSRARSVAANPWLAAVPGDVCHWGLLVEPAPAAESSQVGAADPEGDFALTIGRMGREEADKGYERLLRAWPEVERHRPGFRLVLIGDGADRTRLERLARQLRVAARFLGAVPNAVRDEYLRRCRCFCLPGRGEGFGLVYLEAMRLGKPVLAGCHDGGAEVVFDGVTGRTVDPTDASALLQGLLEVSGPGGEAFGRAGRELFEKRFTFERFMERFAWQVRALTERPPGPAALKRS